MKSEQTQTQKQTPKSSLKLSLKKETLRTLNQAELGLLDGVVGGTGETISYMCEVNQY